MGRFYFFAFLAALNPTLLAATTVMLLLPRPGRLMFGYWAGAMLMSFTLGIIIVYALEGSGAVSTTKHTFSPIANFVLAGIFFILAAMLGGGRGDRRAEARRERRKEKHAEDHQPPKWQQQLSKGTAKTTFVIGALLSLPGASYLAALSTLTKLHYSVAVTVLAVLSFNLIQMLLLEVPMVAFRVAPTRTPIAIEHAKDWARLHGRAYAARALVVLGVLLTIKGILEVVAQ
jgi:hypothetical protein